MYSPNNADLSCSPFQSKNQKLIFLKTHSCINFGPMFQQGLDSILQPPGAAEVKWGHHVFGFITPRPSRPRPAHSIGIAATTN